jgi:hypothetical protein
VLLLEQRLALLEVLLPEQAPLTLPRTLCRRLACQLRRALAVLPLIAVQHF